ncbi:MAG TPA: ECF transporter S component [Candidatus Tetragenococcus pullicola]|nr:ECF transporter S component [Candidatus Tetragenococcus pullicola]
MKNNKVQKMVSVSMFAAMGLVLQYVAIPIMPAFSFLKIDFSDIPVMLSMFLFGPAAGISTAFIRSFLHLITTGLTPQNLVGDMASFLATLVFTYPVYLFFNKKNTMKNKVLGLVMGIIAMSVFMSLANYLVITPLYLKFFQISADQFLGMSLASYVMIGILPFNLIKGTIVSGVFLVLHAKLLPWLQSKKNVSNPHIHTNLKN